MDGVAGVRRRICESGGTRRQNSRNLRPNSEVFTAAAPAGRQTHCSSSVKIIQLLLLLFETAYSSAATKEEANASSHPLQQQRHFELRHGNRLKELLSILLSLSLFLVGRSVRSVVSRSVTGLIGGDGEC